MGLSHSLFSPSFSVSLNHFHPSQIHFHPPANNFLLPQTTPCWVRLCRSSLYVESNSTAASPNSPTSPLANHLEDFAFILWILRMKRSSPPVPRCRGGNLCVTRVTRGLCAVTSVTTVHSITGYGTLRSIDVMVKIFSLLFPFLFLC